MPKLTPPVQVKAWMCNACKKLTIDVDKARACCVCKCGKQRATLGWPRACYGCYQAANLRRYKYEVRKCQKRLDEAKWRVERNTVKR